MYPLIGTNVGCFHTRVSSRLTGQKPWRGMDGIWLYPPLAEVVADAVL